MTTLELERLHNLGYQYAKEASEKVDDHDCKAGPEHGCSCQKEGPEPEVDLEQEEDDMDDDSDEIETEEDPHGLSDID